MKTSSIWRHHLWLVILAATLVGGCEREMREHICTPVQSGDLVISELRGGQSEVDTYGQWIELHNRSSTTLNIAGIRLHLYNIMDEDLAEADDIIMVRDEGLTIAPGGYVVLGYQLADQLPDHVDYGYDEDDPIDFDVSGQIELYVCNELVDYIVYQNMPTIGSLAFDGDLDFSIDNENANPDDLESNWCNDASAVVNPTEVGTPGTPGEQNRPCN